jgi:hypothetical protein
MEYELSLTYSYVLPLDPKSQDLIAAQRYVS